MFIAIVGPNGGGKSTLARSLVEILRAQGREVILTREPGGSQGAEDIRRLILEGDADRWSSETETLLFMAARLDHLERTIKPALMRGAIVVSDRYLDDTRVFQTIQKPELASVIEGIVSLLKIPEADHTFLIDVPTQVAKARINLRFGTGGPDRFEIQGDDFDEQVRSGYLKIAHTNPHRMTIIDGSEEADQVLQVVMTHVQKLLAPNTS